MCEGGVSRLRVTLGRMGRQDRRKEVMMVKIALRETEAGRGRLGRKISHAGQVVQVRQVWSTSRHCPVRRFTSLSLMYA